MARVLALVVAKENEFKLGDAQIVPRPCAMPASNLLSAYGLYRDVAPNVLTLTQFWTSPVGHILQGLTCISCNFHSPGRGTSEGKPPSNFLAAAGWLCNVERFRAGARCEQRHFEPNASAG